MLCDGLAIYCIVQLDSRWIFTVTACCTHQPHKRTHIPNIDFIVKLRCFKRRKFIFSMKEIKSRSKRKGQRTSGKITTNIIYMMYSRGLFFTFFCVIWWYEAWLLHDKMLHSLDTMVTIYGYCCAIFN